MQRFAITTSLAALVIVLGATTSDAEDVDSGRQLYKTCALCHGVAAEGNRAVNAPPLAGREDWYLTRQLRHFRSRVRGASDDDVHGQQMARAALVLWDEREVRDVVAFLTSLPLQTPVSSVQGDAARGKALYSVCIACHGARAEGSAEISAPRLVGLGDWYIVNQLSLFQAGLRGAHNDDTYGQRMKPITATLTDEQALLDVAAYINTLR